jgi:hypothetical protein
MALKKDEANCLRYAHGIYPKCPGHAATPVLAVSVDADSGNVNFMDGDGKLWQPLPHTHKRLQKISDVRKVTDAIALRRKAKQDWETRGSEGPRAAPTPSETTAAAPPSSPRTVKTILRERKKRRLDGPAAYGDKAKKYMDELSRADGPPARNTRRKKEKDHLSSFLRREWRRDARAEFLQVQDLQRALEFAARHDDPDTRDLYTSYELFDEVVPGLGGRTRLSAVSELCAELELAEVFIFSVQSTSKAQGRTRSLLSSKLGVRLRPRRGKTEAVASSAAKRGSVPEPVVEPSSAAAATPAPGYSWGDASLIARAIKRACAAHLARDPAFAGAVKPGKKVDLVVGGRAVHHMVAAVHWDTAQVDVAEMAPVSKDCAAVKHFTHVFTGVVRSLNYREFSVARALAAEGAPAGAASGPSAKTVGEDKGPMKLNVPKDKVVGTEYYSGVLNGFLVSDEFCSDIDKLVVAICGMVNTFETYGSKFGRGKKARLQGGFLKQCVTTDWAKGVGPKDGRKSREARSHGAIVGCTGASCGVNIIRKPRYLWSKPGRSEYTNRPIPYAHSAHGRGQQGADLDPAVAVSRLLEDKAYVELLENLQAQVVKLYGEELVAFILEVVPEEFRLGKGLIWNQAAMTGGSYEGHCAKHVDRFNLLNGLYHFSANKKVKGGETVFFKRGSPDEQEFAVAFKNGRCIVGPFSKVQHGSTAYEGGRAILGANVDRRIVQFCLAFARVEGEWVERTEGEYLERKARYDTFVGEFGL